VTPAPGPPNPRLFRGWWIVLVAIVGQCFGLGPVLVYTFGIFIKPLAEAFKSNRGSIALAVSMIDVVLALTAPGAGRLVDRFGARWVIVSSLLALTACLVGLSFLEPPLWHIYALYMLAGLVGVATVPVTYSRVVANWFDRNRGLALGVATTGVGLGTFITPPLTQFLMEKVGWRGAYLGLAAATLFVALPVGIFLRGTPQEVGLLPDGAEVVSAPARRPEAPTGLTVGEALLTTTFWQLCGIFFCVAVCVNGAAFHLVPLLTDQGMSGRSAAMAVSVFGLSSIFGRVGNGYMVDRYFAPRVAAGLFAGAAAGIALLWAGGTGHTAFLAAALLGLAIGAESDVMPFLISRYFGMRSMAELYGCAFGAYTLGNATGRILFAHGFDTQGSYRLPLAGGFVLLALAITATLTLGRYRVPAVD